MSGFSFTGSLPAIPDEPLKDVPPELVKDASARYEGETELKDIKFALKAEAAGRVEVLADKDDEDDEGVFGEPREDEGDFNVRLDRLLRPNADRAWVKYRFEAGGSVTVGGELAKAEVEVDAEKGFVFADYHAHPIGASARAAVVSDLGRLKLATRTEDVLGLGDGDALTFQTHGRLSAGVTLNWSDVFTTALGGLGGLVASGKTLSVKLSPAASVAFKASVKDDFRIVFTKAPAGVRVSVLKSESRETSLKASIDVKVEFADPKAAQQYLTEAFEAVAGGPAGQIDALLARFSPATLIEQLPEQSRPLAAALAERVGKDGPLATVGELKEKWEGVKEKVEGIIEKAAKTKVAAGFAYEYLRVSQEDALLDVDLPAEEFRRLHGGLMAGRLEGATQWAAEHPEALHKFLRQKSVKTTHAWGFSLGISPWGVKLGGQDKIEKTRVIQWNVEGHQRVAYNGVRGYSGDWRGAKFTWAGDFKAETPTFSKTKVPTTCDFKYGLSFNWGWDEKELTEGELRDLLDHAVIWRAVSAGAVEGIVESLSGDLGGRAEADLELTVDDDALRPLLRAAAAGFDPSPTHKGLTKNDVLGARALAAAMPLWSVSEVRKDAEKRQKLYAPLWAVYFGDSKQTPEDLVKTARVRLPEIAKENAIDLEGLEGLESAPVASLNIHTFTGQIIANGARDRMDSVHKNWRSFAEGLRRLAGAAEAGGCKPYEEVIPDTFERLKGFWSQALLLRAAGVYLLGLAMVARYPDDPGLPDALRNGPVIRGIRRSLTIKFAGGGEDDKGRTVVYSSSAA